MIDQKLFALLISAAISTYALSHFYRLLALKFGVLAKVNQRSAHSIPTPTGAGIVLMLVFQFCMVLAFYWHLIVIEILWVTAGPIVVGIVGYIDDRGELPVKARVPIYLLVASLCFYYLAFPPLNFFGMVVNFGLMGTLLGIVSLFWLQNLFNFMDGVDGIAALEYSFVCTSVFVIGGMVSNGWSLVGILSACIALGYLVINWPKALVFMGDAGSNFLGLMLGILIIADHQVSAWVWLILLAQFWVDACLTVSLRLMAKQKIHESHSQHAYQHLNRKFGTLNLLAITMSINCIWLLPLAYLAHQFPNLGVILLVFAILPIIIKDWLSGAGHVYPRLSSLQVD